LNEGRDLVEVLRHPEVSEATFNRWRKVYGQMKADEAKRLKTLEAENQRLKKLVAEQALDIDMLKELAEGLLTPERRRRAVTVLQEHFGVSQRRACRVVGQHRSTQRKQPRPVRSENQRIAARLREIAGEHPRWGWRTASDPAQSGPSYLWRQEGLRRPVEGPQASQGRSNPEQRSRATHPGQVWAVDFMFDETSDQRRLKLCNILDEYTREAPAIRVDRIGTTEDFIAIIEDLVLTRGAPEHLRADNGPELIASALRDYCRLAGTNTAYIEPASPWENPYVGRSTGVSATSS
jgi:hypothetical protein